MSRNREIYKVTLVGGVANVILLLFKFIAGVLGHSAAMVADAVHSLSDFVTDVVVLVFVRISAKPKDKSHDYGHGKYETLAMTMIGIVLFAVAIGIIYSGTTKIVLWINGETLEAPGMLALWAALLSIVLKEGLVDSVNGTLRKSLDRQKRTSVTLLDSQDDITASTVVDVIRKSADTVNDGLWIPIGLVLNPRGFHNPLFNKFLYVDWQCHNVGLLKNYLRLICVLTCVLTCVLLVS